MNSVLFGTEENWQSVKDGLSRIDDVDIVGRVSRESDLLSSIDATKAEIALICMTGEPKMYRAAQQVYQLRPKCLVMGVMLPGSLKVNLTGILDCGICHIIDPFASAAEQSASFRSAFDIEKSRRRALSDATFSILDTKIIAVYGTKDGFGKTSLAVNIGLALAKAGKKAIVADFDLQFGDCARHLGLNPKRTITDLLQEGESPSIDSVRLNVALHSSGLNVLAVPMSPESAEQVSPRHAESVINALKGFYDYIILDAPTSLDDIAACCFEESNQIFLLTRPTIAALADTKKALLLIDMLGQKNKVKCLLSPCEKNDRISSKEAEKALGVSIYCSIPSDGLAVDTSINKGIPLIDDAPRSDISKIYLQITEEIIGESEVLDFQKSDVLKPKKKSLFGGGKDKAAKKAAKKAGKRSGNGKDGQK